MSTQGKAIKTSLMLSFIILLSKLFGFVREMILAAYFGQTIASDAYANAFSLFSVFTMFFSVAIASTYIPMYSKQRTIGGESKANTYANNILNLYILVAILVSALAFLFAPQLAALICYGSESYTLTVQLTRFMYPSLIFWAITGVFVNTLNARKHFVPEQLMGFAISFCVIFACVMFKRIEAVAIGTACAAVVQVLILCPFLRGNFKYERSLKSKSPEVKRTFLLAVPALISLAFDEVNQLTDKFFGNSMGIGVSTALSKSYVLVQTVLGVLVVPLTTIMFSQLSQYAAEGRHDKLKDAVRQSLELIALITLPIIAIAVINSANIVGVFFQRGNFTAQDTLFTGPVFAFYILGVFAFGSRNFLSRVFYSLQLTRIPMIVGMVSVSLNIVLDILLKGPLGAPGLTLATSVASFVGMLLLLAILRARIGKIGVRGGQLLRIIVSAGACLAVTFVVLALLPMEELVFSQSLARLLISGFAGLGTYFLCIYLMRVDSLRTLMRSLKNRKKKPQANA